jgi:hypothetical protein
MKPQEEMTIPERIAAALARAEAICAQCRPAPDLDESVGIGLTALAEAWGMEVVHGEAE